MTAELSEVTKLVTATVNENERNQGMDFGAHISSIDPICSAAVEAALVPILPNVYLGGAELGAKESTVVVKPVVCAVMVREQERREA